MKKIHHIIWVMLLFALTAGVDCSYSQSQIKTNAAYSYQLPAVNAAIMVPLIPIQDAAAPNDSTVAEKADKKVQQVKELFSFEVILSILAIIIITYVLVRLLEYIVDNLAERASKHRLLIKRLIPIVRILFWTVSLYVIIAGIIDPPFESLIAVAASIGIAVGLASQDILKNTFGGFIIILDRPFQVGDKIALADYYGEVQQIGLRSTRLVTPDDSVVTIPNGDVISNAVSNANSGALYCQVVSEIYLPATIDIDQAKRIARKAAVSSRYVYLNKPVVIIAKNEVFEKNFVIKLRVKAYVLDIRFEFPFQSDMTEQITAELNRRGMIPAG
jgi:small-conductance mechanosensitive channel